MELTFKEIAAIRRCMVPHVELLQSERRWTKKNASDAWQDADRWMYHGRARFDDLNRHRDAYRVATEELRQIEGVLTALKREERRMQKRRGLEVERDRLQERLLKIEWEMDEIMNP